MKKAAWILTMLFAIAAAADDSPLVKAAKASGGPKKKSTRKVITNKDVKSAKGKIVVLPPKPGQATAPVDNRGPLAIQDDERRARSEASLRVTTAQKKVDDLQKELRRIEDAYYAENDPNYRDSTIEAQFNQTKKQLDDARKELAEARDAQTKLPPRS